MANSESGRLKIVRKKSPGGKRDERGLSLRYSLPQSGGGVSKKGTK